MKFLLKIALPACLLIFVLSFPACKKNKVDTSPNDRVQFSQDSVLFDTVFTSIGSATQKLLVRNKNSEKIIISSIQLAGGTTSSFKINVDGTPGVSFANLEIAAKDSMYIFLQVNVDPNNVNSPFIIQDSLLFKVNGNLQKVQLEAWGQNAYYHRPTDAILFSDGTYLPYSRVSTQDNATVTWVNDKPHVIYNYLVVDSTQKLIIQAGVRVYFNRQATLWVYRYGELNVLGQMGNEVTFQGARRDKDFLSQDLSGQWDRIWINEGSNNNIIDYAIIKNAYIGIQAELFGNSLSPPHNLTLTNTKIQNMSKWGLYCSAFNVSGGNNVISNCQEYCLNILDGGTYSFINCTIANYWSKDPPRTLPVLNINNYNPVQTFSLNAYFGNCIIDGSLGNEISFDLKPDQATPSYTFSSCWLKTSNAATDPAHYVDTRKSSTVALKYKDVTTYNFLPNNEPQVEAFTGPNAATDANKFPLDIAGKSRITGTVSAGAYQVP